MNVAQGLSSFRPKKQLIGVDPEAFGNALNVVNRHIPLTPLDTAVIRPVHLDLVSEILLAQAKGLPIAAGIRRYDAPEQTRMRALHTT